MGDDRCLLLPIIESVLHVQQRAIVSLVVETSHESSSEHIATASSAGSSFIHIVTSYPLTAFSSSG
jgi:hypothetical protein